MTRRSHTHGLRREEIGGHFALALIRDARARPLLCLRGRQCGIGAARGRGQNACAQRMGTEISLVEPELAGVLLDQIADALCGKPAIGNLAALRINMKTEPSMMLAAAHSSKAATELSCRDIPAAPLVRVSPMPGGMHD
jgi:hypothetical protein